MGNFYERQNPEEDSFQRNWGFWGAAFGVVVGRGLTSSEMGTQRQFLVAVP